MENMITAKHMYLHLYFFFRNGFVFKEPIRTYKNQLQIYMQNMFGVMVSDKTANFACHYNKNSVR